MCDTFHFFFEMAAIASGGARPWPGGGLSAHGVRGVKSGKRRGVPTIGFKLAPNLLARRERVLALVESPPELQPAVAQQLTTTRHSK